MNDLQWQRNGHDHGERLAADLGYTPLYLHYNSGRHISTNGRELAELLEETIAHWPVADRASSRILGHSLGGLLARSACHYAMQAKHTWPAKLGKIVFLGTPHHGSPLERHGNWFQAAFGHHALHRAAGATLASCAARASPTCATAICSTRTGSTVIASTSTATPAAPAACRVTSPATPWRRPWDGERNDLKDRWLGDGLVPLDSALGVHRDPERCLSFADGRHAPGSKPVTGICSIAPTCITSFGIGYPAKSRHPERSEGSCIGGSGRKILRFAQNDRDLSSE